MIALIEKYRPRCIADLILPPNHHLAPALEFLADPSPGAYLSYGHSGLGKTSLAHLMADAATGDHQHTKLVYSGADLTIDVVRHLASIVAQRPLFGLYHAIVVDEADAIPRAAQVRLLQVLDHPGSAVWLFSSNDGIEEFEPRFVSRCKPLPFTSQGLLSVATPWLTDIAAKEGIPLEKKMAERILKDERNNLRGAIQSLDILRSHHRLGGVRVPPLAAVPSLPQIPLKSAVN